MSRVRALAGVILFALAWVTHDTLLTPFSHGLSRVLGWRQPVESELLLPNYMLTCGLRVAFWLILSALLFQMTKTRNPVVQLDLRQSSKAFSRGFAVATGILVTVALLFVLSGSGGFAIQPQPPLVLISRALGWLGGELLLATAEELAFRGILLGLLLPLAGQRGAVLLSAIAFSAAHYSVGDGQAIFFVYVTIQGLFLGQSVVRTGGLGWAIGYHAAWNWTLGTLLAMNVGGYASSETVLIYHASGPAWLTGGALGPEGSVLTLGILSIVVVALYRTVRWR